MVRHYDPSPRGPDDPALWSRDRCRPMQDWLILVVAFVLILFGLALISSQGGRHSRLHSAPPFAQRRTLPHVGHGEIRW